MSAAVEHDPAVRGPRFSVASTLCADTEDGTSRMDDVVAVWGRHVVQMGP